MENTFRILLIVQLPPPVHGSATISKIISESVIINSAFRTKTFPLYFAKSMQDLGAFSFTKVIKMLHFGLQLIRTIRNFKPDLVYFTLSPLGLSFFRDVLYVAILKSFGLRIVYHLHVKGIKDESKGRPFMRLLYKFVFKNTYTISLSKSLTDDVASVCRTTQYVVNNGVYPVVGETENLRKNMSAEKIQLLYLSNLMKAKGIFVFLDALVLLSKKRNNFSARIVGNPADVTREEIEQYIIKHDLKERVTIENGLYGEEKHQAFKAADIFVHPTLDDAFPLVILEAMQFQLPVISTIEGAIPEIVEDGSTGYLVPTNDATALAEKTEQLLSNPQIRIQMGKAGRGKFLTLYTADKMEMNLKGVLLDILSRKPLLKPVRSEGE